MDQEVVVHIHNGLQWIIMKEILQYATTWMEL